MHQEREYPHRTAGTSITNPDFVQLGRSFGYHAERIERTEDFAPAFERALASATGSVLELMIDPSAITPRATIEQIRGTG